MLKGHAMAENQTTFQLGADRLQRFSLQDESSDNLTIIGYNVMLRPSYLAEIEFIKQNLKNLIATPQSQTNSTLSSEPKLADNTEDNDGVLDEFNDTVADENGTTDDLGAIDDTIVDELGSTDDHGSGRRRRLGSDSPSTDDSSKTYSNSPQKSSIGDLEDFLNAALKIQLKVTIKGLDYLPYEINRGEDSEEFIMP